MVSLVSHCILVLAPFVPQLRDLEWIKIPFRELDLDLSLDSWLVLLLLFTDIPPALCGFTTDRLPEYTPHAILTILSLPSSAHLTPSLLRSTPNLTALDASSTGLSSLPTLRHLRILYLRNCTHVVLPPLPLLSVLDISGARCSPVDSFAPSSLTALFQPDIQASLRSLASLYPDVFPDPIYTLTYLPPKPPKPTPRKSTQDSFVVFSSSTTKIGNTNSLFTTPESPSSSPIHLPLPRRNPSPFHFHRPPPTVHVPSTLLPSRPSTTPASLNNHKALLARKGIDALIKLRSTPPQPTSNPTPIPSSTKKNPFKKPHKPISSFPPPLLPRDHSEIPRKKPKLSRDSSFDWKAWSKSAC